MTEESVEAADSADAPAAAEEPAPSLSASDAALARYRVRMRRSRTVYYAIVAVIVAALGSWVLVSWSRGEAAHASLHTFATPPPTVDLQAPAQQQHQRWRTSDHIALGVPQYAGTLVTYSRHTVGGRDVRTGKPTWSYTRTDRVVCTAAQLSGTTIAVYANHGNCDELSAFTSDTGRRRWTRTLDMDGMPLDGQAGYQITPFTFLEASASVIYAIDPVTGYNRWTYQRYGCRIDHVVLGNDGALISQNCSAQLQCKGMKFCGRGPQLLLRDASAGRNDDDKNHNPDQMKWNRIGDDSIPVSADCFAVNGNPCAATVISSVRPGGLTLYENDVKTGDRTQRIPLSAAAALTRPVSAIATDSADVIWIAGVIYAVQPDATAAQWTVAASSPPVVVSSVAGDSIPLTTARITVPTSTGVAIIDGNDGQVSEDVPLPAPPAGSLVYSAGSGFLVSSPSGIIAYS